MTETSPSTPSSKVSSSFLEGRKFLTWRVAGSVVAGGLLGTSWGYYLGNMAARLGSSSALAGGCLGFQFFGGVLALRTLRGEDDLRNYAVSGSFAGLSLVKYLEIAGYLPRYGLTKNLRVMLLGSVAGIMSSISGGWVYNFTRESWIENRVFQKYECEYISTEKYVAAFKNSKGRPPALQEAGEQSSSGQEEQTK